MYKDWPTRNYKSKRFTLIHGKGQGHGCWHIYDKTTGIHCYSNVCSSTEPLRLALTRAWRVDRAEFDRLCSREVADCIRAGAHHPQEKEKRL